MMSVTGTEDQPARIGVSICDLAGAMTSIYSIITALYHRERTGEGQYIDISLLDASFQFLGYHVSNYFATGENPKRMGTRHPSLMPYQAFETVDSHIVVGVVSEHIWPKFCRAIDREGGSTTNATRRSLTVSKTGRNSTPSSTKCSRSGRRTSG